MKTNAIQIGFSQRIQLPWLEYTAGLVHAGHIRDEINTALQGLLHSKLSVGHQVERGNREKAISILLKVWYCPPDELATLRDEGLDLLSRLPSNQHIAIHWGMCMAVYPFFGEVAATVGRLLRLQQDASTAQVQRRIREQLGERETVARAARRIYRSFIDWKVLAETESKGTYRKASPLPVIDSRLTVWLFECLLLLGDVDEWVAVSALSGHPALFPFQLDTVAVESLRRHPRIEHLRHGVDQEMVRRTVRVVGKQSHAPASG